MRWINSWKWTLLFYDSASGIDGTPFNVSLISGGRFSLYHLFCNQKCEIFGTSENELCRTSNVGVNFWCLPMSSAMTSIWHEPSCSAKTTFLATVVVSKLKLTANWKQGKAPRIRRRVAIKSQVCDVSCCSVLPNKWWGHGDLFGGTFLTLQRGWGLPLSPFF